MHPDPVKEDDDGMFMTANGLVSVEDHVADLFEKADVEFRLLAYLQLEYHAKLSGENSCFLVCFIISL